MMARYSNEPPNLSNCTPAELAEYERYEAAPHCIACPEPLTEADLEEHYDACWFCREALNARELATIRRQGVRS